ncbi:TadE/TadG family type IV pilus assembly protein [Actinokineospora sp. HUAS TT18]|uniref:TadE/TadG family type IV pilus assembly protein n=1 Tax=Actinokineospora sp. HUAS TT18 TaxID=3447451 RepID=UPI003F526CCF
MSTEVTMLAPLLILLLVFVAVVIHRAVNARLRMQDAAHQAARAASIERTPAAATAAARSTAARTLSSAGVTCESLTVDTATSEVRSGGTVSVTISCEIDFSDALVIGIPDRKRLSANAVEPIDRWRSTASSRSRP